MDGSIDEKYFTILGSLNLASFGSNLIVVGVPGLIAFGVTDVKAVLPPL